MISPFLFTPFYLHDAGTRIKADLARTAARDAITEVDILKCEIERLLMITEALWILVKENNGYDEKKLIETIARIDMRDGKLDGRVSIKKGPARCPKCKKTLPKRIPICLYCGSAIAKDPFGR